MPASSPGAGFELVSGPDLGGGFLHQLSVERFDTVHRFVYHAQDGGADANGPPKGSPEPFGYARSAGMCPLGGRVCWHREFTLPLEESLRVRNAYNRTRFVMEAMLAQAYEGAPIPLAESLGEVADRLGAADPPVPWYLGGAAGLWVRGAPVAPTHATLGTTPEGVRRIAEALGEYVREPAAPTDWNGRPVLGARGFVGTLKAGLRVGWSVPLAEPELARRTEWTLLPRGPAPERVRWEGRELPVAPVEATLSLWAERARGELPAVVVSWAAKRGVTRAGLAPWLAEGRLPEPERTAWLDRFDAVRLQA